MANNTLNKKLNLASRCVQIATDLLELVGDAKDLRQEAIDSGFATGGADVITDTQLTGEVDHLTVAKITNFFTAINDIDAALAANARADYIRLQLMKR